MESLFKPMGTPENLFQSSTNFAQLLRTRKYKACLQLWTYFYEECFRSTLACRLTKSETWPLLLVLVDLGYQY